MSGAPDRDRIERFLRYMLPAIETAGAYAANIQEKVSVRPQKNGDAWTSALTDADLGVQHFFETLMLGRFPDWHFFGEEHEQSFNTQYFSASETCVWLDPVNGTRLYRDGADSFDILLSLTHAGRLLATLSAMPRRQMIFGATVTDGAFRLPIAATPTRSPLTLDNTSMTLAVYQAATWMEQLPSEVDVFDVDQDYAPDDPRCCMNSVLTGELGGFLFGDVALLDVGATAFSVEQAGGVATLPDGTRPDWFQRFSGERRDNLLVCGNPKLHAAVSAALSTG